MADISKPPTPLEMAGGCLFSLFLLFWVGSCVFGGSDDAPKQARNTATRTPSPTPSDQIRMLDDRIKPGAWEPLTANNFPKIFSKLGTDRAKDANELAMWAARLVVPYPCGTVKSIKMAPDATKKQLSLAIRCDDTLGLSVSEKGAIQFRHKVDPTRFPDDGSQLVDMYARPTANRDAAALMGENTGPVDINDLDEVDRAIRLAINLAGYPCAKPILVVPTALDNKFSVTCITNRSGEGRSRYIVDSKTEKVVPVG